MLYTSDKVPATDVLGGSENACQGHGGQGNDGAGGHGHAHGVGGYQNNYAVNMNNDTERKHYGGHGHGKEDHSLRNTHKAVSYGAIIERNGVTGPRPPRLRTSGSCEDDHEHSHTVSHGTLTYARALARALARASSAN